MRGNLDRLTFIRRSRDFDFSIDQVRELAGLSISTEGDCSAVGDMAHLHLEEVRAKLAALKAREVSLETFTTQCDTACVGGPGRECEVFESFRSTGDAAKRVWYRP